jgi:hypothetical protein
MSSDADLLYTQFNIVNSEFTKSFTILKEYNKSILIMDENTYLEQLQIVHPLIDSVYQNIKDMSALIIKLESSDISDTKLKIKIIELIKLYNSKIKPKQTEISIILKEIAHKEKKKNESASEYFKRNDSQVNKHHKENFDLQYKESLLNMKSALNDTDFIESIVNDKKKELENIEKVSKQVRDITNLMGVKIIESGHILNKIEDNIVEVKNNAKMTDDQVVIAEKRNSKLKRKLVILSSIVVCIIIILLIVFFISIRKS